MNQKKTAALSMLLCASVWSAIPSHASDPNLSELLSTPETRASSHTAAVSTLCSAYNEFNTLIRDGRISKAAARAELPVRLAGIRAEYYQRGGTDYPAAQWVFPLAGYTATAIDKGRSHGFVPRGYDFFSGNRHGGHPAYDIFIRDRNQDCRDDRTGTAVPVLSMTGGVVVALEKGWQRGSRLRGGNYIWVYDPAHDFLVYYAHNGGLHVDLGTIVKPGDQLAAVGRSGFNAAKRRSPTHLHFSMLHVTDGTPVPIPAYRELQQARSVPVSGVVQ
jgi:murein DD-endopeptidase MepM/ murein hydrolase activator NlpD